MSGEEIASGYLSIGPALTKDFKAKLDAQLAPVAASVGQNMGKATAAAMPAGVSAAGPSVTRAGQDLGRSVVNGMATTVRATAGPQLQSALSGVKTPIAALRQDLVGLAGKTTSLQVVRQAASGVVGSLGGIASMVGYGGPLGIALAAGGLAFGAYAKSQENAKAAADEMLATLNKETGAFAAATLDGYVKKLAADLDKPGDLGLLKSMGFGLADAVVALAKGGDAVDAYIARLEAAKLTVKGSTAADVEKIKAINGLESSLRNQQETVATDSQMWAFDKTQKDASTKAADALGLSIDKVTEKARNYLANLDGATAAQSIFQFSLDSISASAKTVTDRIAAVPRDVTITARAAGIDGLLASLDAVIARYAAVAAAASAANSIVTDGERHGADLGATSTANRYASQAAAAASSAVASTKAALSAHNSAAKAAQATAAATRASKAAAAAAKAQAAAQAAAQKIADQRAALNNGLRDVVTGSRNGVFPDITSIPHTGPGLSRFLSKQLDTLKRFRVNLATLAKRGLPQVFLEQLIAAGLDGAQTAAALVTANDVDFRSIKSLTSQLQTQANALAGQEVGMLYGAGVSAVKGLIAGVTSQQSAANAAATALAKGMDAAFRKALGIHSPSRVFFGHGLNLARGVELGAASGQPGVNRAVLSLVRPPVAYGVQGSVMGAASAAGAPLIGEFHTHNPVPEPASTSAVTALRKVAFMTGRTA